MKETSPPTGLSCGPTSRSGEVYECEICGERHTRENWRKYLANIYDGAPSETDTVGHISDDRAALRDAGRRHPDA